MNARREIIGAIWEFMKTLFWLMAFLGLLALLGFIIYCWVIYGSKTINEIPAWALWIMWGKR